MTRERCAHCGALTRNTARLRAAMLEDAQWLLEQGLSEAETYTKLGFPSRPAFLVALRRAGLAPIPNTGARGGHRHGNGPSTLERLRAHA